MKQIRNDSIIAVWRRNYLNCPQNRDDEDKDVTIMQVEHSIGDDYLVEFVKKKGWYPI